MSNKRIRFVAFLTVERNEISTVSQFLGQMISEKFGGVTLFGNDGNHSLTGFWAADGEANQSRYQGPIMQENVLGIMLSVLPEQETEALQCLRNSAKQAVQQFNLSSRHFHIESSETRAWHTDLNTL